MSTLGTVRRRSVRCLRLLTVLLLLVAGMPCPIMAETEISADAVKAAFLYRFIDYVEWPAAPANDEPFTIAVQCGDSVAEELQRIVATRVAKGRAVQVRRLKSLREMAGAQMLYVGPECESSLPARMPELSAQSVLVVTDDDGALQSAGTINFLLVEHHVRFEVSLPEARLSHLKISSGLLSVAARVISDLRTRPWCVPWHVPGGKRTACRTMLAKS